MTTETRPATATAGSSGEIVAALRDLLGLLGERGGTLRDLVAAIAALPVDQIPGDLLRQTLRDHGLLARLEALPHAATLLESLDVVWLRRRADGTEIDFHFAQPQSIRHPTGVGAVTVAIARTVTILVDGKGDSALRAGDVTARWLVAREPLRIRLRRAISAPGAPGEVLHVSAGNLFGREIALGPLLPSPPLAPPVARPRPTPPEVARAQAPVVLHRVTGRVRLRVPGLYRNAALRAQLAGGLSGQPGIVRCEVSFLTGNVLLIHDPGLDSELVIAWVTRVASGETGVALLQTAGAPTWHIVSAGEVARFWESATDAGLDDAVAEVRLGDHGLNVLPAPRIRSSAAIFLDQFKSLPVFLLAGSTVFSLLTGAFVDGAVILGVILVNASVGYATESWAERTIADLSRGIRPLALAVRGGQERELAGEVLVPGDLIVLRRGMYIAADARLLAVEGLSVDESALTGESVPVAKAAAPLPHPNTPLGERANMVYRGTVVTGGSAHALVVATGAATETGRIQRMLSEAQQLETPLQRQIHLLGTQTAAAMLAICGGVLGLGLLRGQGALRTVRAAISLAVAAVPEGLPAVATTTLALGMRRLQEQQILVRRLVAVEALGAIQYVCLDKTGTLTLNRMTLVAAFAGMRAFAFREGCRRDEDDQPVEPSTDLATLLQLAALCSDVQLLDGEGESRLSGTPTERALVRAALDAGIDVGALRARYPLRRARMRNERRVFMDTLHDGVDGGDLLALKGSPEQALALCDRQLRDGAIVPLSDDDRARIAVENERMAGRALRVLGVAQALADVAPEGGGLIWVGLTGIADPPREGMGALLDQLRRAGIHTTMITGDQSATAQAVAREIGLQRDGILEGLDSLSLEQLPPDVLRAAAQRVSVFSRSSPAHKLRIVQALQSAGLVVAMTGDGVNDGPALRAADIGIAIGQGDNDVAQDVADIVIREGNLTALVEAVEQGRTIYDDIRKAVHFIVSSNTSEVLLTLAATAANLGDVLNPMQLLWINLVTDILPELALGVEPPETDVMGRPPRDPRSPMLTQGDMLHFGLEGATIAGGALAAYAWGVARYGLGPRAGTLAFNTLTAAQLLHAISCRSEPHSIIDRASTPRNPYLAAAVGSGLTLQALVTLLPGFRAILRATPLGPTDWAISFALSLAPLLVNETVKQVRAEGESR